MCAEKRTTKPAEHTLQDTERNIDDNLFDIELRREPAIRVSYVFVLRLSIRLSNDFGWACTRDLLLMIEARGNDAQLICIAAHITSIVQYQPCNPVIKMHVYIPYGLH